MSQSWRGRFLSFVDFTSPLDSLERREVIIFRFLDFMVFARHIHHKRRKYVSCATPTGISTASVCRPDLAICG
ncbi:hypothetical protein [Microcoleus sp. herbarium14]|uniref:hypothetical protein n=1 Tax=Microcoleus sp. herbarium14 TaxID=3055439 RepID=UPI002FD2F336